ncbi:MAG: S-layer homology domain-containing protein [Oscillospiraceae bacterium]|nr:S-layer homology domain-containing protein [Oscillospiraceae bacterium]
MSEWALDAMRWAVSSGLVKGNGDGSLNPAGTATRAEVAQIVMNYDERVR